MRTGQEKGGGKCCPSFPQHCSQSCPLAPDTHSTAPWASSCSRHQNREQCVEDASVSIRPHARNTVLSSSLLHTSLPRCLRTSDCPPTLFPNTDPHPQTCSSPLLLTCHFHPVTEARSQSSLLDSYSPGSSTPQSTTRIGVFTGTGPQIHRLHSTLWLRLSLRVTIFQLADHKLSAHEAQESTPLAPLPPPRSRLQNPPLGAGA